MQYDQSKVIYCNCVNMNECFYIVGSGSWKIAFRFKIDDLCVVPLVPPIMTMKREKFYPWFLMSLSSGEYFSIFS